MLRGLFSLCLLFTFAACDSTRSDLSDDDPNDPPVRPVDPLEGTCSARIDGEPFAAELATAAVSPQGVLDMTCEGGLVQLLFRLQTDAFEPVVLPLDMPGSRAQYRVGQNVAVTNTLPNDEDVGEVRIETFTQDRVQGSFSFNVLDPVDGTSIIRVTRGNFDIELP